MTKRKAIFDVSTLSVSPPIKKPKQSTIRLRRYYNDRKFTSQFVISSITTNSSDNRYYASVKFLTFTELGLLDTGANVSCIGADLARIDFSGFEEFVPLKSYVRTADGTFQKVVGYLHVNVVFRGQERKLYMLIVPAITQRLILGLDFWKSFNLAPEVFGNVVYSSVHESSSKIWLSCLL